MKRLCCAPIAFLGILLMQVGCNSSVLQLRDQLYLHRGEFRQRLANKQDLADKFLACTGQAHDEPSNERRDAGTLSEFSPLQSQKGQALSVKPVAAVIEAIHRQHPEKGGSVSILAEVFDEVDTDTTARLDLDKLKQIAEAARQWHGHIRLDEDQFEGGSSRFARLLLAYNKAYFGDLSYRTRSGSIGTGLRGVLKVTSQGFVDRSGNAFLFPGISAEIEMSSSSPVRTSASMVDSQRVSADLTRIFLEAFFDTAFRVPAVHGATALRVAPGSQESSYPEFDADHPAIPIEALARVTRDSLRAEAAVVSIVGKTVRGGSVLGTQNETLAATLETAAGVIVKKLIEHEGFCYFQVITGQPASTPSYQNEPTVKKSTPAYCQAGVSVPRLSFQ
jgi:hypothetical protein